MTIRLMYAGNDNISCSPITVIAGNSVHTLVSNDMCIEVPGHTDYFILKEAWIKTKPYRLSSDKKQITVIWNKSGSLFLALCQMLLFQCSSFYFKAFIDNENRNVNNIFNEKTKMVLVCPITTNVKNFPLHIFLDERTKTKGKIISQE